MPCDSVTMAIIALRRAAAWRVAILLHAVVAAIHAETNMTDQIGEARYSGALRRTDVEVAEFLQERLGITFAEACFTHEALRFASKSLDFQRCFGTYGEACVDSVIGVIQNW
jgi:hypothetical protein